MWTSGEHTLDLKKEEEIKRFKDFLRESYNNSHDKNVILHVTTTKSSYSGEINDSYNIGSLEERLNYHIEFLTNPEEPAVRVMVAAKGLYDNKNVEFSIVREGHPQL